MGIDAQLAPETSFKLEAYRLFLEFELRGDIAGLEIALARAMDGAAVGGLSGDAALAIIAYHVALARMRNSPLAAMGCRWRYGEREADIMRLVNESAFEDEISEHARRQTAKRGERKELESVAKYCGHLGKSVRADGRAA